MVLTTLLTLALLALESIVERLTGHSYLASLVGLVLVAADDDCKESPWDGRRLTLTANGKIAANGAALAGKPPYSVYLVSKLSSIGLTEGNPRGMTIKAQTWGQVILVLPGCWNEGTRLHETTHVRQYRRLSSLGFWLVYGACWLWFLVVTGSAAEAYRRIPLEVAAYRAQGG